MIRVLPPRRAVGLLLFLLLVFAATATSVILDRTRGFDAAVAGMLHDPAGLPLGPDWLVEAARDFTSLGSYALLTTVVVVAFACLLAMGRWRVAAYVAAVSIVGTLLSSTLKVSFDRPRPEIASGVKVFTASFPSGHATMSTAIFLTLAGLVALASPSRSLATVAWVFAILVAAIVGLTRIYLGVHYATDVLAGWALGASWALVCGLVVETVAAKGGAALTKP